MTIHTKALGDLDIDERQLLTFQNGLIGFDKFQRFALLDAPQKPYFYLQSTELTELNFILLDPFLFRPDYEVDVPDELSQALGMKQADDALILAIVTVPPEGGTITANLMGPLVICRNSRQGIQVVLSDPRWQIKHDVMAELATSRK
ncbi:MAG: flagellar assembly protein FliW [Spirochaetes bacterium GWD1_61_31]|nr:MAG: flagellar assembly protein FliW [Spirochaetes bacterium GWB1_60_80]OHD29487.1 MAG: flagellar assembly protein FliW [Spirochaetes bacterium GWC1_61_12]OHD44018.1 MAG: flagellar assembly protein FliW [Spirochaetes bacterium GWD1_61_31]OHD46218.1 MAG: flagellar assembly protein FliW [Spirochaetes bacterium GWE1_60_18]OHD60776.1 MAG: flagellar assembly protein FliW [Spirochaetes bacterium GWF1_60_12]HAP43878.1 flagellar assembly protein FliW [Spirochaetaceae bacterium]